MELDEVLSAGCVVNDLKTLVGISEYVRGGLLFVGAATRCEDCESVDRAIT